MIFDEKFVDIVFEIKLRLRTLMNFQLHLSCYYCDH